MKETTIQKFIDIARENNLTRYQIAEIIYLNYKTNYKNITLEMLFNKILNYIKKQKDKKMYNFFNIIFEDAMYLKKSEDNRDIYNKYVIPALNCLKQSPKTIDKPLFLLSRMFENHPDIKVEDIIIYLNKEALIKSKFSKDEASENFYKVLRMAHVPLLTKETLSRKDFNWKEFIQN